MGRRLVRNLEDLSFVESIKGVPISEQDRLFLEKTAAHLNVHTLQIGSADTFSMPKNFFVINNTKFVFVRNGKIIPYTDINLQNYFLAYQVKKQVMSVYGYYKGERD